MEDIIEHGIRLLQVTVGLFYRKIEGDKHWNDNKDADPLSRPDVTIHLYSSVVGNGIPYINTVTLYAKDYKKCFRRGLLIA